MPPKRQILLGFGSKCCLIIVPVVIHAYTSSSKPKRGFDLQSFNAGDYEKAVEASNSAEQITSVLYPNDNHSVGKELRCVISHTRKAIEYELYHAGLSSNTSGPLQACRTS